MHAFALSSLFLFALQTAGDDDIPPPLPGESAVLVQCPEPFSPDDALAVLASPAKKRQAVEIAYEQPDLEETARAVVEQLEAKGVKATLLKPGAALGDGPGIRLSRDPLIGLVLELQGPDGEKLGRRLLGPCAADSVLGTLRGAALVGDSVGVGGIGMRRAKDPDEAVERYLDEMLWLDETRVAGAESVQREYAFFQGRDKRAITLEELLEIAGEEEMLGRHRSGVTARAVTFWSFAGAGGVLGAASVGVLGAGFLSHSLGPALRTTPAAVQEATLWPGLGLMTASLAVFMAGLFLPGTLWPPAEEVPEHELRRAVREHNERLRGRLGIETRRDDIPTGVPE